VSDMDKWVVLFHHDRRGSSWWGTEVVKGASARDAALNVANKIDDHAPIGGALRVRVYGPVPSDLAGEFHLSRSVSVDSVFELSR
jgi:hypothetical protein